jgi:hypothetical protein
MTSSSSKLAANSFGGPPIQSLRGDDSLHADNYPSPSITDELIGATGWSMFPSLLPGDQLSVEPLELASSGDVIGYISESGTRQAHRLVGYCPLRSRYLTRGDANGRFDEPVPASAIEGRVVAVTRRFFGRSSSIRRMVWGRRWLPYGVSRWLRAVSLVGYRFLRPVCLFSELGPSDQRTPAGSGGENTGVRAPNRSVDGPFQRFLFQRKT